MLQMEELNSDKLMEIVKGQQPHYIYFYTPLCGTCQLANKMLEIIGKTIPELPIYKCNLNYATSIAQHYQIESVPCLSIWQNGIILEKIYAFHSVSQLFDIINEYENN